MASPRRPRGPNRLGLRLAHVGPGLGLAHISSRDPSRARVNPRRPRGPNRLGLRGPNRARVSPREARVG